MTPKISLISVVAVVALAVVPSPRSARAVSGARKSPFWRYPTA